MFQKLINFFVYSEQIMYIQIKVTLQTMQWRIALEFTFKR